MAKYARCRELGTIVEYAHFCDDDWLSSQIVKDAITDGFIKFENGSYWYKRLSGTEYVEITEKNRQNRTIFHDGTIPRRYAITSIFNREYPISMTYEDLPHFAKE